MNKHIIQYHQKINENIGTGSVLLVKGNKRPDDTRYLYVTSITGYAEIRPGLKMVFIGDVIYRVINKGNGKFAGRKIDYRGEEGLKGVFNMKNQGKPSLVLNNNKTPYHWITLNHTDVGKALREVGTRLFAHDLILESERNVELEDKAELFVVDEMFKLLMEEESAASILSFEDTDGTGKNSFESNANESEGGDFEWTWYAHLTILLDDDKVPEELIPELRKMKGLKSDSNIDVMGELGLEVEGLNFELTFETKANVEHTHDEGDYYTPPSSDTEILDPDTEVDKTDIYVGESLIKNLPDALKEKIYQYSNSLAGADPSDVMDRIRKISKST